jgi:hypothetical protein
LRGIGKAYGLRRFKVRDVGVVAVVLNTVYTAPVSGRGEKALLSPVQRVDNVIAVGPDFARG